MPYIIVSDKDKEIANKYNIDANRAVLFTVGKKQKPYVVEELDFLDEETNEPSEYKRIVAYEIVKTKTDYDKYLTAELDYKINKDQDGKVTICVDDYGYIHPYIFKKVLHFLENQAINLKADSINIHESADEEYLFENDRYIPVNDTVWVKTELEPRTFKGSYMVLDCKIQEEYEERLENNDSDQRN